MITFTVVNLQVANYPAGSKPNVTFVCFKASLTERIRQQLKARLTWQALINLATGIVTDKPLTVNYVHIEIYQIGQHVTIDVVPPCA